MTFVSNPIFANVPRELERLGVDVFPPAILHDETLVAPFQDTNTVVLTILLPFEEGEVVVIVETAGGSRGVACHSLRKAR